MASFNLNKLKKDEKKFRQDRNNSQQSEMIQQRKENKDPIDFQNEFDFSTILE